MKRALITGITGQDGSYLAEHLLDLGYEVHGIVRRVALEDTSNRLNRLQNCLERIHLHSASLESFPSLFHVLADVKPDEIYHLAAQSFVSYSFEDAFSTFRVKIDGTHYLLESVRDIVPEARFYFAGSSEMFGHANEVPQNESTRFYPRSPYGISKVTGFDLSRNYREAYDMYTCSGILFNHESPRRGFEFVTRKITSHVARIKRGEIDKLPLGNLDAKRDWGFAGDYVKAMQLMLQQDQPEDFVIATGETHTVREFCDLAFSEAGLNYEDHVVVDPRYYRPAEVHVLMGDAGKAKEKLGWVPGISVQEICAEMVEADLHDARRHALLKEHGYEIPIQVEK